VHLKSRKFEVRLQSRLENATGFDKDEWYGQFAFRSSYMSIVQDQVGQQFYPHRELPVVVDESHCPEFVHEVRDARPCRAHHFGQDLVTEHGDMGICFDSMFP